MRKNIYLLIFESDDELSDLFKLKIIEKDEVVKASRTIRIINMPL